MARPHFVLTPVGSAGDVHPYLAIGGALRQRGHDVTLLAADLFRSAADEAGLGFVALGSEEEFDALTRHPDLWHPRRGLQIVLRAVSERLRATYSALSLLYEPGRTVLVGHTLAFATRTFEDKHGLPAVTLHLAPAALRSDYRVPAIPPGRDISRAPRWLKRSLWWLIDRAFIDPHIAPTLNAWREQLGLPPVHRPLNAWLHSPQASVGLFPEWFGPPQPDWPPQVQLTGFTLFDEGNARPLDPGLESFLAAGEPPIVFTPGSANRQAPAFFNAAVGAASSLDRRALLLTRFPEQLPDELPGGVRHVAYAPFSRLLPRSAAIVHHGGIGTCAQGLAAGIPQLVMPMSFDQPDNAIRLQRLGVGSWLAPREFKAKPVGKVLAELLESPATAAACRTYAEACRTSDALALTCSLIERLV